MKKILLIGALMMCMVTAHAERTIRTFDSSVCFTELEPGKSVNPGSVTAVQITTSFDKLYVQVQAGEKAVTLGPLTDAASATAKYHDTIAKLNKCSRYVDK